MKIIRGKKTGQPPINDWDSKQKTVTVNNKTKTAFLIKLRLKNYGQPTISG